jgi:hypothetical protein
MDEDVEYFDYLPPSFLKSRRQSTSRETLRFYQDYLTRAGEVIELNTMGQDISHFLASLQPQVGYRGGQPEVLQSTVVGSLFSLEGW